MLAGGFNGLVLVGGPVNDPLQPLFGGFPFCMLASRRG